MADHRYVALTCHVADHRYVALTCRVADHRYVALAKEVHPDRPDGSEERFKAVSKAYALLSDPDRREAYDSGDELDAGFIEPIEILDSVARRQ